MVEFEYDSHEKMIAALQGFHFSITQFTVALVSNEEGEYKWMISIPEDIWKDAQDS